YQPYAEHFYNLGKDVELYKLPNGVGDRWFSDGRLERNVGKSIINIARILTGSSPDFDVLLFELQENYIYYDSFTNRDGSIIFVDKEGYNWIIGRPGEVGKLRNDYNRTAMAILVEKNRFADLQAAKDFFDG